MKNILVLSSSLRKGSNSEILAQEFVKGAADALNGNFRIHNLNLHLYLLPPTSKKDGNLVAFCSFEHLFTINIIFRNEHVKRFSKISHFSLERGMLWLTAEEICF